MLASLDNYASGLELGFGKVNKQKKESGFGFGGCLNLFVVILGGLTAYQELYSVATREDFSYSERSGIMDEESFNEEIVFGDYETGFEMFFGSYDSHALGEVDPLDNRLFKYKVYETNENGEYFPSDKKVI